MNGSFLGWFAIGLLLTLIAGAPLWGAFGFALVSGIAGNVDQRMIRSEQKQSGLSVHPWL